VALHPHLAAGLPISRCLPVYTSCALCSKYPALHDDLTGEYVYKVSEKPLATLIPGFMGASDLSNEQWRHLKSLLALL
jgi:hypothetical protein